MFCREKSRFWYAGCVHTLRLMISDGAAAKKLSGLRIADATPAFWEALGDAKLSESEEFLILPESWCWKKDGGRSLYVRKCYPAIAKMIFEGKLHGAAVIGNPGTSRTIKCGPYFVRYREIDVLVLLFVALAHPFAATYSCVVESHADQQLHQRDYR